MSNCPASFQGYPKPCRDVQGGVKKFWMIPHSDISSFTEASGVCTAITLAANARFILYEQGFQNASATEAPQTNRQNGTTSWEETINMVFHKRNAAVSYDIRSMAQQDVVIVCQEEQIVSGARVNFIYGLNNGLGLAPSESMTGVNQIDMNGYNLVFTGAEPYGALTISQALIDSND